MDSQVRPAEELGRYPEESGKSLKAMTRSTTLCFRKNHWEDTCGCGQG